MDEKTWVKVPYIHGAEGDSSITFMDAIFITKDGTDKNYPDPDFGNWLITQIYDKIQRFAVKKGLFHKKYLCPSCGQELDIDTRHIVETDHQLRLKEFPPFTVRISLPSVECPKCHKVCGIDTDEKNSFNLNEAVIHAFASENIKPY